MDESSYRRILGLLKIGITAAMFALLTVVMQPQNASAQGIPNTQCIRDAINTLTGNVCTANDVRIGQMVATPGSCIAGEYYTFTFDAIIESGPQRYDVGIWIDQEGFDAVSSPFEANPLPGLLPTDQYINRCFRTYLDPVSENNILATDGGDLMSVQFDTKNCSKSVSSSNFGQSRETSSSG